MQDDPCGAWCFFPSWKLECWEHLGVFRTPMLKPVATNRFVGRAFLLGKPYASHWESHQEHLWANRHASCRHARLHGPRSPKSKQQRSQQVRQLSRRKGRAKPIAPRQRFMPASNRNDKRMLIWGGHGHDHQVYNFKLSHVHAVSCNTTIDGRAASPLTEPAFSMKTH